MNLRQAYQETTAHFLAGNAVTWISDPGIGKTESVERLKKWMLKTFPNERLGFCVTFIATQNPTGASGLPWKGELETAGKKYTITQPAIPQWFIARDLRTGEVAPADQFDRCLLLLEEWGQGGADTKRVFAEVLRAGGIGDYYLPKGSFRLALSNSDSRDGITKEYDFIINRKGELPINGDADIWIEDYADLPQQDNGRTWQVMPVTKTWARQNPLILFEKKPDQQGPWCTPRSLTMWDRYAQVRAEFNGGQIPLDDPSFIQGTQGIIGGPASNSLLSTCRFSLELPSKEEVVKDPQGTDIPTRPDLLMLMMYELAARVQPEAKEVAAVMEYVSRVKQQSMHIAFVTALLRRDYAGVINLPVMQAWVSKNKQVVSMMGMMG